jgi:RNA polymerase subunit RPABC4/transcription elongation factor Spt4
MTSVLEVACYNCKYTNVPSAEDPCKTCDDKTFHGNFVPKETPEVK